MPTTIVSARRLCGTVISPRTGERMVNTAHPLFRDYQEYMRARGQLYEAKRLEARAAARRAKTFGGRLEVLESLLVRAGIPKEMFIAEYGDIDAITLADLNEAIAGLEGLLREEAAECRHTCGCQLPGFAGACNCGCCL